MMVLLQLAGTFLGSALNGILASNAPLIIVIGLVMYFFASKLGEAIIKGIGIVLIILAILTMLGVNVLQLVGI